MITPSEPSWKIFASGTCAQQADIIEDTVVLVNGDNKAIGQLSTIMNYTKDLKPSFLTQIELT